MKVLYRKHTYNGNKHNMEHKYLANRYKPITFETANKSYNQRRKKKNEGKKMFYYI